MKNFKANNEKYPQKDQREGIQRNPKYKMVYWGILKEWLIIFFLLY